MDLLELSSSGANLLTLLICSPLIGIVGLLLLPGDEKSAGRLMAITSTTVSFLLSLGLLSAFPRGEGGFHFAELRPWLSSVGANYSLAIDGMSLWLLVLTCFLTWLVVIASESIVDKRRGYLICILFLQIGMLGTFCALDALTFYVFWELMLIPMYFLIGIWGGKRRTYAALKFVLYTAFGSLLMLVAIVYLAYQHYEQFGISSFYLGDWILLALSETEEYLLFAAFALAFAIKIPVFPLHTWLPDAHVEAPTGGSVILAGVLLKMGLYGLIRFAVPLFPDAVVASAPLFAALGVIGIIYGALVAWVQTDIKKLVAYSSVSHLGFCVLGFAAMNLYGFQGSIMQMLNHGISTAALFFLVGVLYDRKHTREIAAYGGLAKKVPIFSAFFLVFTLSSIGLPLTNGFVGEFLILLGAFERHTLWAVFAVSGVILAALYMLSLYRRVSFGPLDESRNGDLKDVTLTEGMVLCSLLFFVFLFGLYPGPVLSDLEGTSREAMHWLQVDEQESFASRKGYTSMAERLADPLEVTQVAGKGRS